MRKSGEWMTLWDDRVLEVCRNDDDNVCKVSEIAKNEHIRVSRSTVSRRCKKLAEHDLLRAVGDGVYILTERGEGYLNGEVNTYEDQPDRVAETDDEDNGVSSPSNSSS